MNTKYEIQGFFHKYGFFSVLGNKKILKEVKEKN